MDTSNKRGSPAVDDILEELKGRGAAPAEGGANKSIDDILAEMGMGGKKPSPFDNLRPGAPIPPAAKPAPRQVPAAAQPVPPAPEPVPVAETAAAQHQAAPAPQPSAPLQEAVTQPAQAPAVQAAPVQEAPVAEVPPPPPAQPRQEEPVYERPARQEPVRKELAYEESIDEEPVAPAPQAEPVTQKSAKKVKTSTMIWDIELEHEDMGPLVGKAAALNRVDTDKYVGDSELNRWFGGSEEMPTSKKASKAAEKEMRRRLAEERKEEKRKNRKPLFGKRKNEDEAEDFEGPQETLEEIYARGSAARAEAPVPAEGPAYTEAEVYEETVTYVEAEEYPDEAEPPVNAPTPAREAAREETYVEEFYEEAFVLEKPAAQAQPAYDEQPLSETGAFRAAMAAPQSTQAATPAAEPEPEEDLPLGQTAAFAAAMTPTAQPEAPAQAAAGGLLAHQQAADAWSADDDLMDTSAFDHPGAWSEEEPLEEPSAFDAGQTAAFSAVKVEPVTMEQPAIAGWKPRENETDTRNFDLHEEDGEERVPTAAYTQEFGPNGEPLPTQHDDRSLYLDDMVDDRFRQFFSETVVMSKEDVVDAAKSKRSRKQKGRSAILTGEFAKMAEMAEQAEMAELTGEELGDDEGFDDYDRPQDAAAIEGDIAALRATLTKRTASTAVITALLLWMGLAFAGTLPLPEAVSFAANPLVFTIVYMVLLLGAIIINFTTVATGLAGLFSVPTVDSAPALAALASILQAAMLLVQVINKQPAEGTLFGALAALILCINAYGKRVRAVSILRNFQLASAGNDHSAAYILDSSTELAYNITKGLEEEDPALLVSRPTTLVKGFLRQSFSQRATDVTGRTLGWIALAAALVAAVLTALLVEGSTIFTILSAFAAVLCIAAPLSSSLVSGVPASLLQKSTARLGAVVPGWSAIEELGRVNVVMAGARDIFPPSVVYLKGIKTFEKERIDVAILYAASVLIDGCDTLRDIFLGVIQGKSDMLYKVESLVKEPGRGFTAWVQNNRVVIGSREMLQKHDITPPPMEIEVKYVPDGHMPVYLAVSGKLFAMFIVGYRADPEVRDTLNGLVKSGVSLLVTSDDMNVTGELIEYAYRLPHGVVKVLGRRELDILDPLTSYMPESDGVMTHIGTFASFIGGMRSAAGCAASERMSSIVQLASVVLACVLCLLLAFGGGLAGLSIGIALLYQLGWTLLVSILPFLRRY